MTTTPPGVTPTSQSAVSRALAREGFTKASSQRTGRYGHKLIGGYVTSDAPGGRIRIGWRPGSLPPEQVPTTCEEQREAADARDRERRDWMVRYHHVLERQGYVSVIQAGTSLLVLGRSAR